MSPGCSGRCLGTVDVFELRPRIGLTSAALAERIPRGERVHDVVVSASYAVVGRWREEYDELDHERASDLLAQLRIDRWPIGRSARLARGSVSGYRSRGR